MRSTVSESADEEASASVGGFNDGLGFVHGAAPVVAPTHETTAASPYVSSLPSSGNPVGRPRSVKQDADLGVAEVTARLDAGYTRAFVTAYFRAQAQVAEPSTQVTWRVTERPSWSYAPAHVALVAAIANTVGIPHKTPIGVMLLTTGLHLLTEALPPVGKVLKVTNGSLAHLGIPPVTRQGVVPSALVAEVRSQYQEEIGIATLPVAFRKQQSWSARGLRDNWSIPKALHGAIRTVARELRLEDSAVANLALRAGVHVLENRVDVFIVPVE